MKAFLSMALLCLMGLGLANAQSGLDDAKIREKIVGTWALEYQPTNTTTIKRTTTIKSDGTVSAMVTITKDGTEQKFTYEATWRVRDGLYIETVTKSDSDATQPGTASFDKVIAVDDDKYTYKTMSGDTITVRRKK